MIDRWWKDTLNMANQITLKVRIKIPEDEPGNSNKRDDNGEDGSDEVEGQSC